MLETVTPAGHSTAVAVYARDIAKRMGLSEHEQALAHVCGLVHDVGKIGLPAGLLEKPGALSLDERREMERHPEIGEEILRNVDDYGEIAEVVRSHHERVDGTGYPDRLDGDEIPILARIIAVADAYNAMTSDRPYRDAMPSRVARLRLAQAVESQFDTSVVAAFEAILATALRVVSPWHRLNAFGLRTASRDDASRRRRSENASAVLRPRRLSASSLVIEARHTSCFGAGMDAELLEDVSHVNLGCRLTNEERLCDLMVRAPLNEKVIDLLFARLIADL